MESGEPPAYRRVVLVGFMGCGKTSVGRELARLLGWTFHDFDAVIEDEAQSSVSDIFRERGEEWFRRLEAEVGRRLLARDEVVLASGGGWPVAEGRMEGLPPGSLSVWLRVTPEVAVSRARSEGPTRPLLQTDDPLRRAEALLREREPRYRKASLVLDSESAPPDALARTIYQSIRVRRVECGARDSKG